MLVFFQLPKNPFLLFSSTLLTSLNLIMSTQTTPTSVVEDTNLPQLPPSPPALHIRENHAAPFTKSDSSVGLELQPITPSTRSTTSKGDSINMAPILETPPPATPKTPSHLGQSRQSSPPQDRATDMVQSFWNPYMNRFRVVACCLMLIGNGLNDAAPGALLNYIETQANHALRVQHDR